jgi:hypothetical protein
MEAKRRFVQNIVANFSYGCFTPHLGIFRSEFLSHVSGTSTFRYKVLPYLCHNDSGREYLSTSATVALFDEFSSISTIISDRTNRGGVSIVLSAENYVDIPPNTEVLIISKSLKIGKTIGFSDLQMFDLNNNLLASGNHIKFLDAGKLWNYVMHPTLFPFLVKLLDSKFMKDILLAQGIYHKPPMPLCDLDQTGSLYPLLDVQHTATPESYSVFVKPQWMNPNKTFHGGAVAISAELASRLSNQGHLSHSSCQLTAYRRKNSKWITCPLDEDPIPHSNDCKCRNKLSPTSHSQQGNLNISLENQSIDVPVLNSNRNLKSRQSVTEGVISKIDKFGGVGSGCAKFTCTWT